MQEGTEEGEIGKSRVHWVRQQGEIVPCANLCGKGVVGTDPFKTAHGFLNKPVCAAVSRLQHISAHRHCGTCVRVRAAV